MEIGNTTLICFIWVRFEQVIVTLIPTSLDSGDNYHLLHPRPFKLNVKWRYCTVNSRSFLLLCISPTLGFHGRWYKMWMMDRADDSEVVCTVNQKRPGQELVEPAINPHILD